MKIIKNLLIFFIFSLVLNSCNTLSEAGKVLRNEKAVGTDEFLIKKNKPLTQPPNFEIIPKPGSELNKTTKKEDGIEEILKSSKSEPTNSENKPASTERSILNQIKK
tara:strand:+ start:564 stop:884 length:321 start_codon:yes stop_codon:yes gene_type:complete